MVLILCLNAAVDKTAVARKGVPGGPQRLDTVLSLPGGKGINVARALRRLGEEPYLLGLAAGYTGLWIERELGREGLKGRWIRLASGDSRICVSVLDGKGHATDLNEPGPAVRPRDLERLALAFQETAPKARLVVLSGSLPPGCPPDLYARLTRLAHKAGKRVLLDTSTPALEPAFEAGPELVKLNREEADSLGPRGGGYRGALERLIRRGVREAVITLGARGAVAHLGGRFLRAEPPKVKAVTPVGCGDTFLAALIESELRVRAPEESLAFATALATASAMTLGAGVFKPKDLNRVLARVRVVALPPGRRAGAARAGKARPGGSGPPGSQRRRSWSRFPAGN